MTQVSGILILISSPAHLAEVEQLADVVRALGAQAAGHGGVRESRDVLLALLGHHQVEHGEVRGHDAAAHRLPLALSAAALAVAGDALVQQQAHAVRREHPLLHGEALLVVAAGDAEHLHHATPHPSSRIGRE